MSSTPRLSKSEYNKKYKLDNYEKTRNTALLRKYGISLEEWNALFLSQGNVCAICATDTPSSKKGWATDHCHTTGKVRGILCSHCNVMLGMSCESPATLTAAITYLSH